MKDFIEGYTMFIDMYYYRSGIMSRYNRFKMYQRVGKVSKKTIHDDFLRLDNLAKLAKNSYNSRLIGQIPISESQKPKPIKVRAPKSSRMIDTELENEIKDFEKKIHAIKDDEYVDKLNKLEDKLKNNGSISESKIERDKRLKYLEGYPIPKNSPYSVFGTDRLTTK